MKVVSVSSFEQKFRKLNTEPKQNKTDYATPTRFVQKKNQSALF
jgi:hypothetical protein